MSRKEEPRPGEAGGRRRAVDSRRRAGAGAGEGRLLDPMGLDDVPAPLVILSGNHVVLECNEAFLRLLGGLEAEGVVGSPLVSLLTASEEPRLLACLETCLAGALRTSPRPGPVSRVCLRLRVEGGGEVTVRASCRGHVPSPGGDVRFVLVAVENVGDCISAPTRQEEYEQTLGFIEAAPDAIITTDEWGRIETFNPAAERIFGWLRQEATGKGLEILFPDYGQVAAPGGMETGDDGEPVGRGLGRCGRRKNGDLFPMDFSMTEVRLGGRLGRIAIIRDVSERERLKRAVVEISEREQRRLGRDLHDGLSQILAGVSFLAGALEHRLQALSLAESADARRLVTLVGDALAQVRRMARGLYPVEIETKGLGAALASLAAGTGQLGAVSCSFEAEDGVEVLDPSVSMHLFRIAQEALHNALRHAKPHAVRIALGRERGRVVLSVVDDGIGIPMAAFRAEGLGLHSMHERARMVGADLEIVARPQGGTAVICSLAPEHRPAVRPRTRPPRGSTRG